MRYWVLSAKKETATMLFRTLFFVLIMAITGQASESMADSTVRPIGTTIGIALGTPAVLNPVVSHYFGEKYGVRLSGGYLPSRGKRYAAGFQANFVRKIRESRNILIDGSLVVGYMNFNTDEVQSVFWRYIGLGVSGKWKALYYEYCLTVGSGNGYFSNPTGLFQLGVVFYTERKGK